MHSSHRSLLALTVTLVVAQGGSMPAHAGGPAQSLRQALEAQGWEATETPEGTVLRRPATTTDSGPEQGAPANAPPASAADFEGTLRESGWRVEQTDDGGLLLYPPHRSPAADQGAEEAAEPPAADTGGLRHWNVRRTHDGGWIFVPASRSAENAGHNASSQATPSPPATGTRDTPCVGIALPRARVRLPVDTWSEAHRLGEAWIQEAGLKEAAVGRIREILRVYLVSIVTRKPPHRLLHQIAVRRADGHVIVLD